jgi:PAS domain S-box-containing protein
MRRLGLPRCNFPAIIWLGRQGQSAWLDADQMSVDHRSEALQRDARRTLADAIKNSPFGVLIVDDDFRLMHLSAQRVFSNVNPLLGLNFGDVARHLWPESFANEVVGRFRHCLESGKPFHGPTGEMSGLAPSVDWQIERVTLPDGRHAVACQFYDLRDRQHMEAVVRRSERRFRLALDAAAALVYEVDVGGNFAVTYGLERLTGYRPEDVSLTLDWWYSLIHPDDLPAHRAGVARHLLEGGSEARVFRIRHKDGRWIWVESIGQVLKE